MTLTLAHVETLKTRGGNEFARAFGASMVRYMDTVGITEIRAVYTGVRVYTIKRWLKEVV